MPNDNHGLVSGIVAFYETHPLNESQILQALEKAGKNVDALAPEDLFPLDQDHYGGLEAVDVIAERARISAESRVLDVCAGLGGPARYVAWRFGCDVTGIDLTESRCRSAARLTELVGLTDRVRFVHGDAAALPFEDGSFTACLSQEALVHVHARAAAIGECFRVLAPGGRLAFTDWTAAAELADADRERLASGFSTGRIESEKGYRSLLAAAGFADVEAEDLSASWRPILRERLQMYRSLREETVARFGRDRYDEYDALYAFFVRLVDEGVLGGGRFSARRPG